MLHKSKSTRNALLKYGLSAPLFAAMMILSSASFKSEKVAEGINAVSSEAMDLIQPGDSTESDYQQFLKRNPSVKALEWKTFTYVTVILKSGKRENYSLNRPEDLKKAEGLYGSFPQAPPPPPPSQMANTPQTSQEKEDGPLFTQVDDSPEFPGGMKAFYEYLTKNFHYPEDARKNNVNGRIILQFVVEKDGRLTEINVLRGLGSGLDEEAIRVLKASPNWKPGIKGGMPVRVAYTLPVAVMPPRPKTGAVADTTETKTFNGSRIRNGGAKSGERSSSTYFATDSITIKDGDITLKGKGSKVKLDNYTGLIFLNGVEKTDRSFVRTFDPNHIHSVNILKKESATLKYGNRGKDGAIEITLKN